MKNNFKKILTSLLIISIIIPNFIFPVRKAEAGGAIAAAVQVANWIEEKLGKTLRDMLSKKIMDYINDATVKWVQGGGEPKFVTDLNQLMNDISENVLGQLFTELNKAYSCSPYQGSGDDSGDDTPQTPFSESMSCTLIDVVENAEDFQNDFSKGGWEAYVKLFTDMGNTNAGSLSGAASQAGSDVASEVDKTKTDLATGGGFLSVKRCKGGGSATKDACPNCVQDTTKKWCPAADLENITPGALIKDTLVKSITSDIDWSAGIQSWMSALIGALIDRVTQDGIGLAGMGDSSTAHGSVTTPQAAAALKREIEKAKEDIVIYIANGGKILGYKRQSAEFYEQAFNNLSSVKNNCPDSVSDAEMESANKNLEQAQSDVLTYDNLVSEAAQLQTDLDPTKDFEELYAISEDYGIFVSSYPAEMINEDAVNSASLEVATAQAAYDASVTKLNGCGTGT